METMALVARADVQFHSPEWDTISADAKDFIISLLERVPFDRPTAAEALKHPWLAKYVVEEPGIPPPRPFALGSSYISSDGTSEDGKAVSLQMDSTRRTAFQKFLGGLKVRKALHGAAQMLTPKEAKHLGEVLRRVDKDRDGKISVVDLDIAIQRNSSFSASVRQNLKEMRGHLLTYPKVSFDIRPYIGVFDKKAKSDSKVQEK